jgi:hypothetical protein
MKIYRAIQSQNKISVTQAIHRWKWREIVTHLLYSVLSEKFNSVLQHGNVDQRQEDSWHIPCYRIECTPKSISQQDCLKLLVALDVLISLLGRLLILFTHFNSCSGILNGSAQSKVMV